QRVALARALIHDPDLLFLDEPHAGLDEAASVVLGTLLDAVRRRGRSILLVTHDLARALTLADRLVILRGGRILLERTRDEVEPAAFTDLYVRCLRGEPVETLA